MASAAALDINLVSLNIQSAAGDSVYFKSLTLRTETIAAEIFHKICGSLHSDGTCIQILRTIKQHTHDEIAYLHAAQRLENANSAYIESVIGNIHASGSNRSTIFCVCKGIDSHLIMLIRLVFTGETHFITEYAAAQVEYLRYIIHRSKEFTADHLYNRLSFGRILFIYIEYKYIISQSERYENMEKVNIDRINELARIAKERELTPEEAAERAELRKAYLENFRAAFRQQLDSTVIQREDGSREAVKDRRKPS